MAMYFGMNDMNSMRPFPFLVQHVGLGLNPNDLLRSALVQPQNNIQLWRMASQDTGSTVHGSKDRFQVKLDVQHFSPNEIQVKVVDNSIVVEGKHEEKQDEHGYISRNFVRRYVVPKDYRIDAVASSLSSDGVLIITAPRVESIEAQEVVPTTHTGGPVKEAKGKKQDLGMYI